MPNQRLVAVGDRFSYSARMTVARSLRLRSSIRAFAVRLVTAAAVTAAIGALANFLYELLFDPGAYAAGSILARVAFAFIFPLPLIVAGLLLVGAPVACALSRASLDSVFAFAVAGATSGGMIGLATASGLPRLQMTFVAYGCVSAIAFWMLRPKHAHP